MKKNFIFMVTVLFVSMLLMSPVQAEVMSDKDALTPEEIISMFINSSACSAETDDMTGTFNKTVDDIEYTLNIYSDNTYDICITYPEVVISETRSTTTYRKTYQYLYPIVDGWANLTATAQYTYNSSTGTNTINSCLGGGSDVVLYGWGVYGTEGRSWGNAVSEGYEFVGLKIVLTPKTGSAGLDKHTYYGNPY